MCGIILVTRGRHTATPRVPKVSLQSRGASAPDCKQIIRRDFGLVGAIQAGETLTQRFDDGARHRFPGLPRQLPGELVGGVLYVQRHVPTSVDGISTSVAAPNDLVAVLRACQHARNDEQ